MMVVGRASGAVPTAVGGGCDILVRDAGAERGAVVGGGGVCGGRMMAMMMMCLAGGFLWFCGGF
jgi:hypothetical protein